MEALAGSQLFEGDGRKYLSLDAAGNFALCLFLFFTCFPAHREEHYYLARLAMAVSLDHGGPPPTFLSDTLHTCLSSGMHAARPQLDDIQDKEIYNQVKQVSFISKILNSTVFLMVGEKNLSRMDILSFQLSECSTVEELSTVTSVENMSSYLDRIGCLRPIRMIEDKAGLVCDILMSEGVTRVAAPFER